jgi:hypothetical protein
MRPLLLLAALALTLGAARPPAPFLTDAPRVAQPGLVRILLLHDMEGL